MKLKHIAHAFKALILGAVLASGFAIPSYAGKADIELLKSYVGQLAWSRRGKTRFHWCRRNRFVQDGFYGHGPDRIG